MAAICDKCGGTLLYSPKRKAMFCNKCGNTSKAEEIEDSSKEYLLDKKIMSFRDVYGTESEDLYDCNIYTCNHCGADILINGTETSTVCIYCGSPNVVFTRIAKQHKPEGIIPFSVSKEDAEKTIKSYVSKAKFAPASVRNVKAEDIKGIYIPYWIVNADFYGAYEIYAEESSGRQTHSYLYARAAECEFKAMPIDASTKLNDELSRKLEPYFFDDVKPFDEDYLSGFYSDMTDLTPEGLRSAALKRMDRMMGNELMASIPGRNKLVRSSHPYVNIHEDSVYLLLPAWFYTFECDGKPYTLLINGQSGKTVGFIPPNRKKIISTALTIFFSILAVMMIPFLIGDPLITKLIVTLASNIFIYQCLLPLTAVMIMIPKLKAKMTDVGSVSTFTYVKRRQE